MSLEVLISIVGAFGIVALSINAWFLKGIYSELNDVRIQMASIISGSNFIRKEVDRLEKEFHIECNAQKAKYHDLANELMSLKMVVERLKK